MHWQGYKESRARTCTHTHTQPHTNIHTHNHKHTNTQPHTHTHPFINGGDQVHPQSIGRDIRKVGRAHAHAHIITHTHNHTHTHTHTHTPSSMVVIRCTRKALAAMSESESTPLWGTMPEGNRVCGSDANTQS